MTHSITLNAIKCRHCGTIVESTFRHDFRTHSCPKMKEVSGKDAFIAADGGLAYARRIGNPSDWEEASQYGNVNR
jgi:hypothetical protein